MLNTNELHTKRNKLHLFLEILYYTQECLNIGVVMEAKKDTVLTGLK